jgi:quinoprotein relay system zinc metallohydrolase 2
MAGRLLLSRRALLLAGASVCCLPRHDVRSQDRPFSYSIDEVAPGIHVREGVDSEATTDNSNAIANLAFIIGRDAVAVTDPGGSLTDGRYWRDTIRRVTRLPIRYVIIPHVHPDHLFGAAAFESDKPVYVGHARLPGALAQRGEYYRERLEQVLGKESAGRVVSPSLLVENTSTLDLGNRILELTAHPVAHTDCDVSVFDRQTRTLLPSDLLFVRRVPSLDGSLTGWLKTLAALKSLPAQRAVPGHGPPCVDWPAGAGDLERYLEGLLNETRQALAQGLDISAAVQSVGLSERNRWALFDDYHGHNVTKAFKELEWE